MLDKTLFDLLADYSNQDRNLGVYAELIDGIFTKDSRAGCYSLTGSRILNSEKELNLKFFQTHAPLMELFVLTFAQKITDGAINFEKLDSETCCVWKEIYQKFCTYDVPIKYVISYIRQSHFRLIIDAYCQWDSKSVRELLIHDVIETTNAREKSKDDDPLGFLSNKIDDIYQPALFSKRDFLASVPLVLEHPQSEIRCLQYPMLGGCVWIHRGASAQFEDVLCFAIQSLRHHWIKQGGQRFVSVKSQLGYFYVKKFITSVRLKTLSECSFNALVAEVVESEFSHFSNGKPQIPLHHEDGFIGAFEISLPKMFPNYELERHYGGLSAYEDEYVAFYYRRTG
jgi:hypothetical protein